MGKKRNTQLSILNISFTRLHLLVSYAKHLKSAGTVRERMFLRGELCLLSVSGSPAAAMQKERASPCSESKFHRNDVEVSQKPTRSQVHRKPKSESFIQRTTDTTLRENK